jgi:hypothetical protein
MKVDIQISITHKGLTLTVSLVSGRLSGMLLTDSFRVKPSTLTMAYGFFCISMTPLTTWPTCIQVSKSVMSGGKEV